jgi:hypothetical protein
MRRFYCGSGLALILTACGGGGDAPISTAHAQVAAKVEVAQLHAILRPDAAGRWFIQNDADHMPIGIVGVTQVGNTLRVDFDRDYTHAGQVTITSDDQFNTQITGHAGLGRSSALIGVWVRGVQIDPSRIRDYVPGDSGNFWISATMVNRGQ